MSDEGQEGQEGQVDSAEVEKEARQMGWLPKEEYRGKEENWVDAETFVEKGRHVLPIVQENNKRLLGQVNALNSRLMSMEGSLKAANATIQALEESHADDVKEQVKAARKGLVAEIEQASRDGDHATLAKLTGKLTELNTANADAGGEDGGKGGKGKKPNGEDTSPQIPPALQQEIMSWFQQNPDYRMGRRAALANAVSMEFRQNGDARMGAEFLNAVAEEVEKTLGEHRGGRPGKAEGDSGGRGRSAGGGGSSGGGKTYADLPPEAKAACDRMAQRVVGDGRKHKDVASWRKSYVTQYFSE